MVSLVGYLALFTIVGIVFLLATLLMGTLVRPNAPNTEKKSVYECGEPTIGSSWVQFDLRFYVVALLFVIFDVEVAFFFPWAVVFGKAGQIADTSVTVDQMAAKVNEPLKDLGFSPVAETTEALAATQESARLLGQIALGDLLVFFGIVLVGFAYLWKRGDINWIRALGESEQEAAPPPIAKPDPLPEPEPAAV